MEILIHRIIHITQTAVFVFPHHLDILIQCIVQTDGSRLHFTPSDTRRDRRIIRNDSARVENMLSDQEKISFIDIVEIDNAITGDDFQRILFIHTVQ